MSSSVQLPDKLAFLFEPARYKVLYGGRGGAKSWGIARALLLKAAQAPLRILCAREIQKSIDESVHQLLSDQITECGLEDFYTIKQSHIEGQNGSQFAFAGLKHNARQLKSFEGIDIVWCEEADAISKHSWDILIPTIRKEGSEIWISFNPQLVDDVTYQRFVVNPPPGARVEKIGWQDNPWFPAVLNDEREHLKATDEDAYSNVWEGNCIEVLEGAVYAKELRRARDDGRITRVPYDPIKPVSTFWDLGYSDSTAIWFAQRVGFEMRVIDYYECARESVAHYLQVLQDRRYVYATHYLPHDARAKTIGSGASVEEQVRATRQQVRIVPMLSVADGINAARGLFPMLYFDETKCADGLHALRHYSYKRIEDRGTFSKTPEHDWSSHGADAFRYMAVAMQDRPKRAVAKAAVPVQNSWMA